RDPGGREFLDGPASVGFGVAAFVAVVVGQGVGENEKQPIRCARLGVEDSTGAADAGAEPGVAGGAEFGEPSPLGGAETLVEGFDRRKVDGMAAVGAKSVDRDAVAQFVEGGGEGGGRATVMLVY